MIIFVVVCFKLGRKKKITTLTVAIVTKNIRALKERTDRDNVLL